MHGAFRPCAVVDIPRERIDAVFAYGTRTALSPPEPRW